MSSDLVIKVKNLYKAMNGTPVLKGLNLGIRQGEKLCIVGSSGCGKSVLVRHFNGLEQPDSGNVLVFDQDLAPYEDQNLNAVRQSIGYVFQDGALFSSMTVGENLAFFLTESIRSIPATEVERRVARAMDYVGLGPTNIDLGFDYHAFLRKMPPELSGGQKKRVAVARELVLDLPIMIYDEPTTGLDPENVGIITNAILQLHSRGNNTAIVITHAQKTMEMIGDRIIMLKDGTVFFDGPYLSFVKSSQPEIQRYLHNSL